MGNYPSAASIDFGVTNKFNQVGEFINMESTNNKVDCNSLFIAYNSNIFP